MYSERITLLNRTGLHARPASAFVGEANKFKADITIKRLDENGEAIKSGLAKSIVSLLTMKLSKGTQIELAAEGEDEKEAVGRLVEMIVSGFGEL